MHKSKTYYYSKNVFKFKSFCNFLKSTKFIITQIKKISKNISVECCSSQILAKINKNHTDKNEAYDAILALCTPRDIKYI